MSEGPSTVHKALALLDFFNERRPTIGLSEFAKLSGYNKATALRFLAALEAKGFVEQDEETRVYKLGSAFLRFSQLREASFPLAEAVRIVLRDLNAATDETALASVIAGETLASIGIIESKRMNRVIIEPGASVPFHATASGFAYLAFASEDIVNAALKRDLKAVAGKTLIDPVAISEKLVTVRELGIAYSDSSIEDEVLGIAAPYFGASRKVCGAVAIGLPAVRATKKHTEMIELHVKRAARQLTALRGGAFPDSFPNWGTK